MNCPNCGAELTEIDASHDFVIEYSEEQGRWVKSEGFMEYVCGNCLTALGIHDIEDILKQVDEL